MPRQRIDHSRFTYVFPDDFRQRLKLFIAESRLSRSEIARRLGTHPFTVWRWTEAGVRPHFRHQMALLALAEELGLRHLFTDWTAPCETGDETSAPSVPSRLRSAGRTAAGQRDGRNRRR